MIVCVCVREPPWHMGAEGHSFWFFIQHLCRGTEGLQGAPSTEALPCNPGKRTCIACAWAPLWAAGGRSKGQKTYP